MSFFWFLAVAILVTVLLSRTNFGNLGAGAGRLPARGAIDGHPDGARQDRLLHDLLGAGGFCRHPSR